MVCVLDLLLGSPSVRVFGGGKAESRQLVETDAAWLEPLDILRAFWLEIAGVKDTGRASRRRLRVVPCPG